ncbi:hypothetical protein POM88_009307 [Heracleum sosnowskyi]|uniref:Uncharacterized protein n=1 Tax=Heracleum sosnowskyi TaxID=360622 RepID=A0AAD8J8I2_9APIA|nr:hypothetical protein POM88_009307 [Heracleum sosnowskyi]
MPETNQKKETKRREDGGGFSSDRQDDTEDLFSGGLSSLSIAVRLLKRDDYNRFWFKVTPPKDLRLNKDRCCFLHSHDDDIKNFYKQDVDLNSDVDISTCKYPLVCPRCACIGSTVYIVGGDRDMEGDVCLIYSERIGTSITQRPIDYVSPVWSKKNLSHRIGSYDFLNPVREQIDYSKLDNAPQLVSPRYLPQLVAVGGKLFLFGGNLPPQSDEHYVPFAEVFDPATGLCSPIKDPPFPSRIGNSVLFLAPFLSKTGEQNILVMAHLYGYDAIALYDVHTDSWESFSDPEGTLFRNTLSIIGKPIPVAEQDSIYWLRNFGSTGLICSYNWKTKDFWEGPFIGLQHELPFFCLKELGMILLHIRRDLFSLVWTDFLTPTNEDNNNKCTHIHFTLLRVSREDPPSPHLSAFVVGCFSYVLPLSVYTLLSGYCL